MQKYLRLIVSITLFCSFVSCTNKEPSSITKQSFAEDTLIVRNGKDWIIKNIESFFNNDDIFMKGFSYLCTDQYTEFKKDATNIDLDGGMTEAEFKSKWGRRVSEYAGIGEGFMVAGTDFGKIEVTKCDFKNVTEMNHLLYDVLIADQTFNSKFTRQVVLIKSGNSFLIDNVLEISNEFHDKK